MRSELPLVIFAGGAPRSGLTLLRRFLSAHSQIFCGPDTNIAPALSLQWANFRNSLGQLHDAHFNLSPEDVRATFHDALYELLGGGARAHGAKVIVEKSPLNVIAFRELGALAPEARFLHVVRDGRDVVASLLERDWADPNSGERLAHTVSAEAAALYWRDLVAHGLQAEQALAGRVKRVSFEALVAKPKRALKDILRFAGADWEDAVFTPPADLPLDGIERESAARLLQPIDPARAGRWRRDLCAKDLRIVEQVAGAALRQLGYATAGA